MLRSIALALSAALSAEPEVVVTAPPPLESGPAAAATRPFEPASPWEIGTSAGGGWDSNPLALTVPAGSQFAAARVWIARELRASAADALWLQVRYGGARFATLRDADLDRVEASAEWGHRLGDRLTFRLVGAGALRFAGDPARNGWDAGGRAIARLSIAAPVGLRLGGGYTRREASDPAYSGATAWLDAGVDVAPWPGASVVARGLVETETDALSGTAGTGGMGSGWRGGAGSGAASGPPPASRVAVGFSADVRQQLWGGIFLQAGYGLSQVRVADALHLDHQAVAEVGWSR